MDTNFQQGYEYFRKNADAFVGAVDGADFGLDRVAYVDSVQVEIDKTAYDMVFDENEQRYEYTMKGLKPDTYNTRLERPTTHSRRPRQCTCHRAKVRYGRALSYCSPTAECSALPTTL